MGKKIKKEVKKGMKKRKEKNAECREVTKECIPTRY